MKNQNPSTNDTLTQKKIIAFLRAHKDKLERDFGVTQIALFGSYARGEQQPDSDIDLLIETKTPSFDAYCDLKYFLEENLKRHIDLGYFKAVRQFIKRTIQEDLIYA